jgi:hypothetical protein
VKDETQVKRERKKEKKEEEGGDGRYDIISRR